MWCKFTGEWSMQGLLPLCIITVWFYHFLHQLFSDYYSIIIRLLFDYQIIRLELATTGLLD